MDFQKEADEEDGGFLHTNELKRRDTYNSAMQNAFNESAGHQETSRTAGQGELLKKEEDKDETDSLDAELLMNEEPDPGQDEPKLDEQSQNREDAETPRAILTAKNLEKLAP